jgi:broad specificity phosphatase PhoE
MFLQRWSGRAVPHSAYEELLACGGEWPAGEERRWEPHSAVHRRVGAVLRRYADFDTVAVVCHEGVIEATSGASHFEPCGVFPLGDVGR